MDELRQKDFWVGSEDFNVIPLPGILAGNIFFLHCKQNHEPLLRKIVKAIKCVHINGYEQKVGLSQTSNKHLLWAFVFVL